MTTHSQYIDFWVLDESFPTLGQKTKIYVLFAMGTSDLKWVMVAGETHQLEINHLFTSHAWTETFHVNIREIRKLVFSRVTIQKLWHLVAIPKLFFLCYDTRQAAVLFPDEQKKEGGNRMSKMYSEDGTIVTADHQGLGWFFLTVKKINISGTSF